MIGRFLSSQIESVLFKGKVIQILGPRQTGKSTLLRELAKGWGNVLWLNGDERDVRYQLQDATSTQLKQLVGPYRFVVIDEAQRVENIGLTLKLMVEHLPTVQIVATGSSSFELANKINEPLTGRKYEFTLFPISFSEMASHTTPLEEMRLLEQRLIYGYYPEIVTKPHEAKTLLELISSSYLYRDLFDWQQVRRPKLLEDILQALALQIGHEVSFLELAQLVGADKETVERYIDLLEKSFVIFRLGSLSRNLRSELKRARKIYFWDIGVRNAIIKNFNPLNLRSDFGALWENFLVAERTKRNARSLY